MALSSQLDGFHVLFILSLYSLMQKDKSESCGGVDGVFGGVIRRCYTVQGHGAVLMGPRS